MRLRSSRSVAILYDAARLCTAGLCQARLIKDSLVQTQLPNLVTLAQYREARQQIFPSDTSLDWFLRKHRPYLVAVGGLLMIAGRWLVSPMEFDAYVLANGRSTAQARTSAAPMSDS
jgi:hypothetical protein